MNAKQVAAHLLAEENEGRIGIVDARSHLPTIVEHVAAHGPVVLTVRGKPVAIICAPRRRQRRRGE